MKKKVSIFCTISSLLLLFSCSNQKNTKTTRLYHEINTRYNIYFNAEQSYINALESKNTAYVDNLSEMIYMYPYYPDEEQRINGFETTIDKCVKAIKLHSISVKPERDPNKRSNMAYQEWLSQREFNPFLKNAWLLMAKAEYQSLDYLRAVTTFSHITRLYKTDPETATEARLWIANAYLQMNWIYEAENVFRQIELAGGVPDTQKGLHAEAYANYLIRSKKYEEAIPYLQTAIKNEDGAQSMRFKYLLGQLYAKTGNRAKAYEAFGKVPGLNTPYMFALNAKLQQAQYINPDDRQAEKKVLSSLNKMTKSAKNEEYLDQIHYTIGNIYLRNSDTLKAIDSYTLAIRESTRNGYDKAITQVMLGDIYFKQKDYIHAQPLYPEALGILGKKYERYDELMLRSEVLDKLAIHAQAIHLQDSLQTLARMPENERLEAINKLIADLKKKDEEEKKKQARADWNSENPDDSESFPSNKPANLPRQLGGAQSPFYFYNPQTVVQGKTSFRKLWGNRKLEDNWRRKNKSSSSFGDSPSDEVLAETGENVADSISNNEAAPEKTQRGEAEIYTPEFYLSQLPLTPEAIQESNEIIEDACFQMGLIYKDDLLDFNLAIETFDTDMRRFPQTPNLEEIYYQLFLIYTQLGDKAMADNYRAKLLNQFAEGSYAKTLSDPDYEWNLRNLPQIESSLYHETYDAYLAGNTAVVRKNYTLVEDKYPLSKLRPKFMFLDALSYAQTNEPATFKNKLSELVEKYPEADVTTLASEMLKGINSGKILAAGGTARGMIWNIPLGGAEFAEIDTITQFKNEADAPHQLMLIFDPQKTSKNDLLYNVADYNFSNFVLQTFDLNFSELTPFGILQVSEFASLKDVAEYTNKIFEENSLIGKLDSTIIILPISTGNYAVLSRGKSLNDYFEFFKENYGAQMPQLIAHWDNQLKETAEEEEPEKTEEKSAETSDTETNPAEIETESIDDIKPLEIIIKPKVESVDGKIEKVENNIEEAITDKAIDDIMDGANDVNDALDAIVNNPVDGIKSLINSIKNKPKLTKEEKETLKEEKRIQKELDKAKKAREKAAQDSINTLEKARQDSIKNAGKEKVELEKTAIKAKEDALKAAAKAKVDAQKAHRQELKDKEKARAEELKAKEKARKEKAKQREAERREKEKQAREKRKK
ncbi:type IX secretion system periplasmic lipoprotein PorW/SprE [Viscerimonas tarda]